ncbi:MAG: Rne/Rng family ribonuclease [Nocardioidaceae bacterium]|nr:Rne/Rng family ribonuclease [Nocardioidaceae bacterium]
MLDESTPGDRPASDPAPTTTTDAPTAAAPAALAPRGRRRAASRPAGPPAVSTDLPSSSDATSSEPPPAKKSTRKGTTKTSAAKKSPTESGAATEPASQAAPAAETEGVTKTARRRPAAKKAAAAASPEASDAPVSKDSMSKDNAGLGLVLFQAPTATPPIARKQSSPASAPEQVQQTETAETTGATEDAAESDADPPRRRRRRGGRRRRKPGSSGQDGAGAENDESAEASTEVETPETVTAGKQPPATEAPRAEVDDTEEGSEGSTRRRRRRRRHGEDSEPSPDDPANTVVRVRAPRSKDSQITSVEGSTRLEAKKQRRREGREAGRRRAPIVSEAEFLARRESVRREMVIRQRADVTQIAVVEDGVLVEHYVARESQTSLIGNVYIGRVQNVLPSMEAAFVDIGKGRNAVLYAGEVDWKALGRDGKPRKIEDALKSGQTVLVQVSKDPVGNKGARLTSQISLPGRFLVYVPAGQTSGISRKLPDTERNRLKDLMKGLLPEDAGVIIRTAAEGATEDQLTRDVTALTARWDDITAKVKSGQAPALLYGEPDLMIKVVRDLFNEDFTSLVVDGDDAWDMVQGYVTHVAPDLGERLQRWEGDGSDDVFTAHRLDEQIAKGLERKVWLPSGGSLVIDRTEAMTVVDVNTGKFTGSGGNLEETVTKNNLEAAEEMVRQLRLRDIGGIIVIDFIDMVLEDNRELVLRRLVECLGRDRTRHQVAEVTSLGLVQMTRKRIGTGLLEAFSSTCDHCQGRGVLVQSEPVSPRPPADEPARRGRKSSSGKSASAKPKPEPAMVGASG